MNLLLYSSFLNQNRRSFDNGQNQDLLGSITAIYDICISGDIWFSGKLCCQFGYVVCI